MANYLVIVESPAKVKTIKKFLGANYEVDASGGHVRDLPKSQLGFDAEHDYEPKYITIRGKGDVLAKLRKEVKKADKIYLATDPDREGEAISWHLMKALKLDELKSKDVYRISFNEITKNAVKTSFKTPRELDMNLVNAQQTRRMLDRMVGYRISPLLWAKVKRGLSAGRVQSVALRMICDREDEINAFIPEEYWNLEADLLMKGSKKPLVAKYYGTRDSKGGKAVIRNKEELDQILGQLEGCGYEVEEVKRGERVKKAPIPFTTSTLQQEASKVLNFSTQKTMRLAQQLYEGVEVKGKGTLGLITYLRTDSTRIADEADTAARAFVKEHYGENYVAQGSQAKKEGVKIQDAHEAIRPSVPGLTPDEVDKSISGDTAKLYRMIWSRFMASQMADCQQDTVSVTVYAGGYRFKASGYTVTFDGFTALYEEATDEKEKKETSLPPLEEGQVLKLRELKSEQKFTQPPARYTEATLIKALEENGIGRPSTYAPIITTIIDRGYVEREQKKLKPTLLGRAVDGLMLEQFPHIVDVDFSAEMEKNLDKVESGKTDWHKTVDDFYKGFAASLEQAEKNMEGKKVKVPDEPSSEVCDLCGRPMVIKVGKYGKFLACSGFPECRGTKRLVKDTGGICPKCGKGRMLERKSAKGRIYYGCERYPDCDFMTWDMPVAVKCEKCGSTLFRKGSKLYCAKEGCDFEMPVPKKD